ncbi:MAG: hypothetical protein ABSC94_06375 [Polyangiaceae bacterium]|jgi:hypothetical protein
MQRQDYLERMLEQVAAAIARAAGFSQAGRSEEAQRELDGVWSSALGLRRGDVERFDEPMLRVLLGPKIGPAAALLDAQADLLQMQGDGKGSVRLRELAQKIRL